MAMYHSRKESKRSEPSTYQYNKKRRRAEVTEAEVQVGELPLVRD